MRSRAQTKLAGRPPVQQTPQPGRQARKRSPGSLRRIGMAAAAVILWAGLPAVPALAFEGEFSGDDMDVVLATGRERVFLTGNAYFRTESTTITADTIELYGDDYRYARGEGSVRVVDDELNLIITCDSFFYDRIAEYTQAEGNAVMEDLDNEVVVKGGLLENRNEEDLTLIFTRVRIFQGTDLTTWSEFARYRRDTNILELSGLPRVIRDDDEFRANRIVINLDTDEITLQGEVQGVFTSTDDEETPGDDGAPGAADTGSVETPGADEGAGGAAAPGAGTDPANGDNGASGEAGQ